jgi:hypothetical protein
MQMEAWSEKKCNAKKIRAFCITFYGVLQFILHYILCDLHYIGVLHYIIYLNSGNFALQ